MQSQLFRVLVFDRALTLWERDQFPIVSHAGLEVLCLQLDRASFPNQACLKGVSWALVGSLTC